MHKSIVTLAAALMLGATFTLPVHAAYYTEGGELIADPTVLAPTDTVIEIPGVPYTIQKGDTLGFLSVNFYGVYDYANEIGEVNQSVIKTNGGKLVPGMVINLPAGFTDGTTFILPATPGAGETLYMVKEGDTLSKISKAYYGTSKNFPLLFNRNTDRLKDARTIYVGQVIVLPAKEAAPVVATSPSVPAPSNVPAQNSALGPGMEG